MVNVSPAPKPPAPNGNADVEKNSFKPAGSLLLPNNLLPAPPSPKANANKPEIKAPVEMPMTPASEILVEELIGLITQATSEKQSDLRRTRILVLLRTMHHNLPADMPEQLETANHNLLATLQNISQKFIEDKDIERLGNALRELANTPEVEQRLNDFDYEFKIFKNKIDTATINNAPEDEIKEILTSFIGEVSDLVAALSTAVQEAKTSDEVKEILGSVCKAIKESLSNLLDDLNKNELTVELCMFAIQTAFSSILRENKKTQYEEMKKLQEDKLKKMEEEKKNAKRSSFLNTCITMASIAVCILTVFTGGLVAGILAFVAFVKIVVDLILTSIGQPPLLTLLADAIASICYPNDEEARNKLAGGLAIGFELAFLFITGLGGVGAAVFKGMKGGKSLLSCLKSFIPKKMPKLKKFTSKLEIYSNKAQTVAGFTQIGAVVGKTGVDFYLGLLRSEMESINGKQATIDGHLDLIIEHLRSSQEAFKDSQKTLAELNRIAIDFVQKLLETARLVNNSLRKR